MLLIHPNEFEMGSPREDAEAQPDEQPQHHVTLSRAFYLSECEVTHRQFLTFVERSGYVTEAERPGQGGFVYDVKAKNLVRDPQWSFRNPGPIRYPSPADDEPVVRVTWSDAQAFCEWMTKEEQRTYRLPTEAEWEYACRAGTKTRWSTGDDPATLDRSAWIQSNAGSRLHPVGQKAPNRWGLRDMHGNAWEWCEDWYGAYAPPPVADPPGPAQGRAKVLRGGSWDYDTVARTRSASRISDPPDRAPTSFARGFRAWPSAVARPAPPAGGVRHEEGGRGHHAQGSWRSLAASSASRTTPCSSSTRPTYAWSTSIRRRSG